MLSINSATHIARSVFRGLRATCLAGLGVTGAAMFAGADVLVLESPGSSYPTLQAAVDAASDGDTLIVGEGSYESVVIDGKGLTLRAAVGALVEVHGQLAIRNVPTTSVLRVHGFKVEGRQYGMYPLPQTTAHETALDLANNAGPLRFFRCEFVGGSGEDHGQQNPPPPAYGDFQFPAGGHGARASACFNLAFLDCELVGGRGSGEIGINDVSGGAGGHGLYSLGSSTATYDSRYVGGNGALGANNGGHGGDGVQIQGFGMFASGSDFRGGEGGNADPTFGAPAGNGGDGIWVRQDSHLRLVENSYAGGEGGCCTGGVDGAPRFWEGGTVNEMPGTRTSLRSTRSLVADGETFHLQVEGLPGERVFIVIGTRERFQFTGTPAGVELAHLPQQFSWGQSKLNGASGTVEWQIPAWELPAGTSRTRLAQARVLTPSGMLAIGGSVLLTAIDDETGTDCDGNGRMDLFDIASGTSPDCNGDLVPDTCIVTGDCNANGIDDAVDIACGDAVDSNGDGIPDTCQGIGTVYVNASAPVGGDGSTGAPFRDLASAFGVAVDGGAVSIAPGLYQGPSNRSLDFAGRDLVVQSTGGAATCVIDLQGATASAFQSLASGGNIRLRGLTIRNGNNPAYFEGAVKYQDVRVSIEDCVFVNNTGGALSGDGELILSGSEFRTNGGTSYSGAIFHYGRVRARNCLFEDNSSATDGGAVGMFGDSQRSAFSNCRFVSNTGSFGGALRFSYADVDIDGCLFANNTATGSGGAVYAAGSIGGMRLTITNATFANNRAQQASTIAGSAADLEMRNSILWGNTSGSGAPSLSISGSRGFIGDSSHVRVERCNVEGGASSLFVNFGVLTTDAITDTNPSFVNAGADNFRLGVGSPCIDAGSNFFLPIDRLDADGDFQSGEVLGVDLDGNPRQLDDPSVPDTGAGSKPLTDLGAFES